MIHKWQIRLKMHWSIALKMLLVTYDFTGPEIFNNPFIQEIHVYECETLSVQIFTIDL